jgi:hypothetical protein
MRTGASAAQNVPLRFSIMQLLCIKKREKSTLRQIPAPPDHFAQVEVIFVNEKKRTLANVTGIIANTNFELTFAPRRAISSYCTVAHFTLDACQAQRTP